VSDDGDLSVRELTELRDLLFGGERRNSTSFAADSTRSS